MDGGAILRDSVRGGLRRLEGQDKSIGRALMIKTVPYYQL